MTATQAAYPTDPNGGGVSTRTLVEDPTGAPAGAITVDTQTRYLYLSQGSGKAIRYAAGVGREGFGWQGHAYIGHRAE